MVAVRDKGNPGGARNGVVDPEYGVSRDADRVVNRLAELGFKGSRIAKPVRKFVARLGKARGPRAAGFVYRDEGYVRPILDVYLLWSSPIDLESTTQTDEMDALAKLHGELAVALDPHLDTFLDFVDPGSCPTLEEFEHTLAQWRDQARRGEVVHAFPTSGRPSPDTLVGAR